MNRIKKFLKKLKATTRRPEMSILPGQLAFYFLLMMIPIFTVVVVILQQLELTGAVRTILYDTLPNVVADLIVNISNEDVGVVSFWALLISAFIISSNGTYSIIIASNTIYKVENQSALLNRAKSLVMVLIMILTFVVIFTVPLFGNTIATFAERVLRLSNYHIDVQSLYGIFKYPVTLLFLFLFVKLLYTIAPNVKLGLNKTSYGALFTSIMWIIVTMVYSVYIEKVVNYETIYGGLSSLLCLLIWLSIISYIFVLGMALNASYYSINKDDINYIEKGLGKTKSTLSKLRKK